MGFPAIPFAGKQIIDDPRRASIGSLFRRMEFEGQGVDLAFELGRQRLVDEAMPLQA